MAFLPACPAEYAARGPFDFVIVTGDSYVDHPSFGVAIVGRVLEAEGFSVAVLARPDPDDAEAFRLAGRPRLAWLAASGVLDSMVSSYTANRRPRSEDAYAPGGNPALCLRADGTIGVGVKGRANARPDRAVIAYAAKCREAFKGVPVVLGGLEASLRRLSHYDHRSDTVRRSILLDSKADLLVHGMAERQLVALARRLAAGEDARAIRGLRGTAWWTSKESELPAGSIRLPPFAAVTGADEASRRAFAESFAAQYRASDPWSAKPLVEEAEGRFVVVEPPEFPLRREELDRVWALPFERRAHPLHEAAGGVPALSEVKFSVAATRGCFGACAFCAIAFHQGRVPSSRSRESIVAEVERFARDPDWKGIVHDVGGPTANFLGPACAKQARSGPCPDRRCLSPEPCPALEVDHREWLGTLRALRALPGVRKVFVRSGIRFDHLMLERDPLVLRELAEHHVSGQLKVAPEHVSDRVLALMGKPPHRVFEAFATEWRKANDALGKRQFLVPYFIASHPGATLDDAIELALWLKDYGFVPDQVQDFYPTPGTLATAMYRAGLDPLTLEPVHVARGDRERAMQRALLQFDRPENRATVLEALREAGRAELAGVLLGKGAEGGGARVADRGGARRP